jgi:UDPglucose 6-dehydrogenase
MHVTIIGTGYVGLVSGVCLAAKGHKVCCVDINPEIVEDLNRGIPHIHERGLEALLRQVIASGHFLATASLAQALDKSDGVIIAVGTPNENGAIDLKYICEASRGIGTYLKTGGRFLPVVVKSTVIPGTTDTVVKQEIAAAAGTSAAFGLGMNPEFLREGEAVTDFMEPDRIVLGYEDDETRAFLEALYAGWACDKLYVNTRTAELIKYANNALLATQISAINEIANLAAVLGGIDVMDVVRGVHLDKRWNPIVANERINPGILTYLVPGCGFGGSCLPKDVQALRTLGQSAGLEMSLLNGVLAVNDAQPRQIVQILQRECINLAGLSCLLLGLAFKPDTDDTRESASLKIVSDLLDAGCKVTAHDPIAAPNFKKALGHVAQKVTFVDDWYAQLKKADCVIIATKWQEYKKLVGQDLSKKIVFDARRMFEPSSVNAARYLSIGRRGV